MPALVPTDHSARVVWLRYPPVPVEKLVITAQALAEMQLSFAGFAGEVHAGLTRPSCSRVLKQYPRDKKSATCANCAWSVPRNWQRSR